MKALVCQAPGSLKLIEKERPTAAPGQALVRIRAVGICGSDLHIYHGRLAFFTYPGTPGHEMAGELADLSESGRNANNASGKPRQCHHLKPKAKSCCRVGRW